MVLLVLMLTPFFSAHAITSERPFNNAANWGGTGLMEIPNARVLEDGEIRAGIAQAHPFRWYSPAMGVFPGLEVDFRLTEILNSPIITPGWEGYGNDKDKALDLKYQIFPESKKFPAMAVGLHDIQGTERFSGFIHASPGVSGGRGRGARGRTGRRPGVGCSPPAEP